MVKLVLIWADDLSSVSTHSTDKEARQIAIAVLLNGLSLNEFRNPKSKIQNAVTQHELLRAHGKVKAIELLEV